MILVGYLPVTKLECFSKAKRQFEGYQLFHKCMASILNPLVEAGQKGVEMICADGRVRRVFPILTAYIADHPEQCLVTCCMENCCPKCVVSPAMLGDPFHSALHDHNNTLQILAEESRGMSPQEFEEHGLRLIWPFWSDLPHCDIFSCITPDLLHQLHKGLFNDHIVSWSTKAAVGGAKEIDARFQAMPPHPTLRHFKKGISLVTQWTGTEYKNMEKVYLGVIAGITGPSVIQTVRGVLDFIYYAHFETHTFRSLARLDNAWVAFHRYKEVFIEMGIRTHFNIPKIHASKHYVDAIRSRGSADGYNSEGTERLHIDYAKIGYRSTNKKDYIMQMTKWLTRQEKIDHFTAYLQWAVPATAGTTDDSNLEPDGESRCDTPVQDLGQTYFVAKTPSYLNVPLVAVQKDFGATDILPCIDTYLRKLGQPGPHSIENSIVTFSLYKRINVWIPAASQVSQCPIKDTIIATRPEPPHASSRMKPIPGQFSTALIRESERDARSSSNAMDGAA